MKRPRPNNICFNCDKLKAEHSSDFDGTGRHCPTNFPNQYYTAVNFVPCSNLDYLAKKYAEKFNKDGIKIR